MDLVLTKTRFAEGIWEGVLNGSASSAPALRVLHNGVHYDVADVSAKSGEDWLVRIALPACVLGDGLQTVLVEDAKTGTRLEAIHILAGQPLDEDLRAELNLLREELELLKRAFRNHCSEKP